MKSGELVTSIYSRLRRDRLALALAFVWIWLFLIPLVDWVLLHEDPEPTLPPLLWVASFVLLLAVSIVAFMFRAGGRAARRRLTRTGPTRSHGQTR